MENLTMAQKILVKNQDFEELKNIYTVLNDGPIRDMVKSLQQELISKLTF